MLPSVHHAFEGPKDGPLLLFYKVGPSPAAWWGMLTTSDDGGQTWSQPRRLPEHIDGPVKNRPVQLPDGSILAGSSTEHDGWRYTQTAGGVNPRVRATAKRDTVLYLATATCQPTIDTAGWAPEPELTFGYTDGGRTRMHVFRRAVRAGEPIELPQGNWTGGVLLAPPEE